MKAFLETATRFLFFTGKGGVGKTSMACATAVALADAGKRVLLISTDPASNLDEVLGTSLGQVPKPVAGIAGLEAMNIDPEAAALAYRERIVAPYRGVLPDAAVKSIEEQLSGACTVEIASFNEFTRIIGDPGAIAAYDNVILDTAPTGHTLRLLSLPAAWNDFIANNKTGGSCLGPLSGLKEQRLVYEKAVSALTDPAVTLVVLVTRAERAALKESARAGGELAGLGIRNQCLIVNGIFAAVDRNDRIAMAFEKRGHTALAGMPEPLKRLTRHEIPFHPRGFVGIPALRGAFYADEKLQLSTGAGQTPSDFSAFDFSTLVESLARNGSGVVMTMGKGGVGKTTIAAAIAVELARRGFSVHLSTTDPAAHVQDAVDGTLPNLRVSCIDPVVETRAHVAQVMATAGTKLDAAARALLEEELSSPCTEEIAVFQAFARIVAGGKNGFVVLDTAPTGHTLLLLDATEAYHREVLRSTSELPEAVRELLPRLRDHDFTKVLLVTLAEATPVHEAAQLQKDLRRAGIEPFAWVINQCFSAARSSDPALQLRAQNEMGYIRKVTRQLATSTAIVPWIAGELSGSEGLQQILRSEPATA
jgi:arsenite-transporting ATPase